MKKIEESIILWKDFFFSVFFKVNKSPLLFTNRISLGNLWQKGSFSGALLEWVKRDGAECKKWTSLP